ncbi:hypothetical protein BD309DRAFT_255336 [Dichomitus squalens]|uniref:Uncharacterized protein n=2 Tax=Dichomitus squalens TaxID=114155 RepID=A0A4Q9NK12_9APHY|nr:uncharacterized protein DICSQDRAFT_149650 [Dichomitus squalens LYAD-421 SS1]EJF57643.1 hypothetical protein DICSQDRAFT_149650 [Dichomitus squalens LYAD-421 SS1]TBU41659.1 hypothetical protein BD309DRAFT_255336 [Dichomitus squalens]TBU64332.1 hypothetical protein BD310DRAFT_393304 [Dichomitus squalens]
MQSAIALDTHAPPGSSGYLTGLLSRARAAHPDLPLDSMILRSLLTCLIARPQPVGSVKLEPNSGSHCGLHLILRTKEEDVGMVVNVATLTHDGDRDGEVK